MVLQAAFMLDLPFILRSSGTAVGLPNDNKFFTRTRMRVHRLLETPLVFERSSANVILATFFTTHVRLSVSSHMPPSPPVYSPPSPTTSQSSDTSQYLIQHTHAGKPKDRSACPTPHTPPPTCSPNNSFSTAPPTRRTSSMPAPRIFPPHPRSSPHCNVGTSLSSR
jgi:hypothetical protein